VNSVAAKVRVFVVDDDQSVADTLTLILRDEGYSVETFYDSKPALQRALASPPDVVVTDFALPSFDGLKLAALLEEHCPGCRVIVISGQSDFLQMNPGPNYPVFEKPMDAGVLIECVRRSTH
jgi:DNA-binding NtrC family response regulator